MKPDDPAQWAKWGKWVFSAAVVYYGWEYILMALALCGAYHLWQEYYKQNPH